jgi:hypothetical protein
MEGKSKDRFSLGPIFGFLGILVVVVLTHLIVLLTFTALYHWHGRLWSSHLDSFHRISCIAL